jgi:hypothetical protein
LARLLEGERDRPGEDRVVDGVQLQLKGRRYPEVAAAAANAPKEVAIVLFTCQPDPAVSAHDLHGVDGIESKAVAPCQLAEAAPRRQASDPDRRCAP